MHCSKCGTVNLNDSNYCSSCGKKLSSDNIVFISQETEEKNGIPKNLSRFFIVAFISIIIVAAAKKNILSYRDSNTNIDIEMNNVIASGKSNEKTIDYDFQYEDSIGVYIFGNGTGVEIFSDSLAYFCYSISELTDYQKKAIFKRYDSRYMYFQGEITGISETGVLTILCIDKHKSEEYGLLWPMQGFAELTLIDEQQSVLYELNIGDSIAALGRFQSSSYYKVFGMDTLVLSDGIIVN